MWWPGCQTPPVTTFIDWLARQHAGLLFLGLLLATLLVGLGCARLAEWLLDDEARGLTSGSITTAVGVIAALYAVMVAFVIVNEWSAFADAQSHVSDESAALVATYTSAGALPEPGRTAIQRSVLAYDRTLVCNELPSLATNEGPSPASIAALRAMFATVAAHPSDSAFYSNVVSELDDVATARRSRINSAVSPLPNLLLIVIVVTSGALLATVSMLDTRHRRWHYAITGALAVIIALNLTLIISLDRPFAGAARVSDSPYREGVPASVLACPSHGS
jgi:Protein of unknown function (DUF4239)